MPPKFSQATCIAQCVACTLAEVMRDCPNCPFSIGRGVKTIHEKTLRLGDDKVAIEAFWETIPDPLWQAYYEYAFKEEEG